MPRQTGKSTTCISYLLHYAVFNDNVNIAVLANKASTARDLLGRLQLAYENLPKWMQQGIISWNKGSLELENGSKISANSTSSSAVRGVLPIMSSFLTSSRSSRITLLMTSLPLFILLLCLDKAQKVIIVSTPRGMNHFYRMWHDAEKGKSEYVPTDVHWSEVPEEMKSGKSKLLLTLQNNSLKLSLSVNS